MRFRLALLICLSACAPEEEPGVSDDAVSAGRLPEEGSPAALGAVRAANELDVEHLVRDVGLPLSTARTVVNARPIDSIAELDAVAGVGTRSIERLIEDARRRGALPVRVRFGPAQPEGERYAAFYRPDGTLIASSVVEPGGAVEWNAAGGTVVVAWTSVYRELGQVDRLEPGDDIWFWHKPYVEAPLAPVRVLLPEGVGAGKVDGLLFAAGTSEVSIAQRGDVVSFFAHETDGTGEPTSFSWVVNQALDGRREVRLPRFEPALAATVVPTNPPTNAVTLTISTEIPLGVDGTHTVRTSRREPVDLAPFVATTPRTMVIDQVLKVDFPSYSRSYLTIHDVARPTLTVDLRRMMFAEIYDVVTDADATIRWYQRAQGRQAASSDGGVLETTYLVGDKNVEWRAVFPPDATKVRLPALPPEMAAWAPPRRNVSPEIWFGDLGDIAGYTQFKSKFDWGHTGNPQAWVRSR